MGLSSVLETHRAKVNRVHRVRNADQLVTMVDAFGFCFAFTLRTGDAPIPACFDHLSTSSEDRKWEAAGPQADVRVDEHAADVLRDVRARR